MGCSSVAVIKASFLNLLRYSALSLGDDKNRLLFANPEATTRKYMTVKLSYDEGKTWSESKLIHPGLVAYNCMAVLPDGSIGMLYERGVGYGADQLTFVRFTLDWLTDGRDTPPVPSTATGKN